MTHHTLPVRPSSTLLTATRWLAGLHAAGGVGLLALAGYCFLAYRDAPGKDPLEGLLVFFGIAYAVLGVVLVVLGAGATWARTAGATYVCGLAAGLFVMVLAGVGGFLLVPGGIVGVAVSVVSLSLVACSVVGLARRVEPSPVSL